MAGLILVVIVGAWLAVLVPMALRSHDSAASLKSADRFGDAMRVLSRRSSRDVLVPRRPHDSLIFSETKSPRPLPTADPRVDARREAAHRRRRTLLVLVGISWLTLGLWLAGVTWGITAHLVSDALLVGFAVHLRTQAKLKAQRRVAELRQQRLSARRPRPVPAPRTELPQAAGLPTRLPARSAPLDAPLPAPAARYEDKPVTAATVTASKAVGGAPWSPVPVPPPMYAGKAPAPRRPPRVLDLTKPGEWTAALEADDIDLTSDGPDLEDIIERRRAVNGW